MESAIPARSEPPRRRRGLVAPCGPEEVRREQAELRALLADESGYHEAAVHALLADSGACSERVSPTGHSYNGLKIVR